MKNNILLLLIPTLIAFFPFPAESQTPVTIKKDSYKTWVNFTDDSNKFKGYLSEIGDSQIILVDLSNLGWQTFQIEHIQEMKFRRKGRVGRGVLFGALAGIAIGGIIGFASGDDVSCYFLCFSAETKAVIGGVVTAFPGALIGAVVGSAKIKIPIQGDLSTFKRQKDVLRKYQI